MILAHPDRGRQPEGASSACLKVLFQPGPNFVVVAGKHEHEVSAFAGKEDPDLQPGAQLKNGRAQLTDAKAGMHMRAAQDLGKRTMAALIWAISAGEYFFSERRQAGRVRRFMAATA